LDQFQRKKGFEHHFGKSRTKNLDKGLLVIRFEMPFKVQCLRCSTYVGQGTRYDADKKKVGKYFSTPLYEFAMRCGAITGHDQSADGGVHCNQRFVIRTDPKNDDYELVEGLRRKVQTWEAEDAGNVWFHDSNTRQKMAEDPMFRVEKVGRDLARERSEKKRFFDLEELQAEREDTYALNCRMRRLHRDLRKEELAREEAKKREGKANFALPMQPPSAQDSMEAASVTFRTDHDKVAVAARRAAASAAPLFRKRRGAEGGPETKHSAIEELVGKRRKLAEHARMAALFGPA